MITGILSIFHVHRVEPSCKVMDNTIDKKSGRINLETYSTIQGIKYGLKARHPIEQNRWKEFHRKSRLHTPINPTLTRNMRSSFSLLNAKQKTDIEKLLKRRHEFNLSEPDCTTNKKLKLDTTKQAGKAQNHHQQILAGTYSAKSLSVQSENTENTKDGQEEPIVLDAEQPAE